MAPAWPLKLRLTATADRQITSIVRYIAQENAAAALRVAGEIRDAALLLAEFPEAGRPGLVPGTREWVVHGRPYVIVYRVDDSQGALSVVQVVHGAQKRGLV